MKTDGLFYTLFQKLPTAFFETLGLPPETADLYIFDSVEVKALSFRIDGVFLPQNAQVPIYFVEVQFQKDVGFYARFFSEIFMYLDKAPLSNDWRGVVIYPRRSLDSATEPQNARYRELLESARVQRFYLNELEESAQQLPGIGLMCLAVEPEIGSRARAVLAQARNQGEQFYDQVLEMVEKTLMQRFPDLSQEELFTIMDIKLSDWRNSRVYRETKEELREEVTAEVKEEVRAEVKEEVRTEVKEEVRAEAKLEAVHPLLQRGFSVEETAQILGLTVEQVKSVQP